jgi:GntP family gluconate:H+ symporter
MKTGDIYKGSIAFVILQLIMVVAVMWQPQIILYGLGEQKVLDVDSVNLSIEPMSFDDDEPDAAAPKMPAE